MADEHRTPPEVSHGFARAITAGDLEAALACWSPAAVIVAPDGSQIRGHGSLTERFRQLIAAGAQLQIAVDDQICTPLGALATTRMTLTLPAGDGSTVIQTGGVVMYVPGQGGLRILIDRLDG